MPLNLVLKVTICYLLPLQMPHTEFCDYRSRGFGEIVNGRRTTNDGRQCTQTDGNMSPEWLRWPKMLKGTKNTSTTLWSYGVHFLLLMINYVDYRLECKLKLLWDIYAYFNLSFISNHLSLKLHWVHFINISLVFAIKITPFFEGPSNLVDQVTSSEIFLAWVNPVLPKDFPVPLQYQVVLEREDGTKRRGVVTYHKKSSRFKCEFGRLWSATSYAVKCFTLVEGKRKYAPTVIKLKTKNGNSLYSIMFRKTELLVSLHKSHQ